MKLRVRTLFSCKAAEGLEADCGCGVEAEGRARARASVRICHDASSGAHGAHLIFSFFIPAPRLLRGFRAHPGLHSDSSVWVWMRLLSQADESETLNDVFLQPLCAPLSLLSAAAASPRVHDRLWLG